MSDSKSHKTSFLYDIFFFVVCLFLNKKILFTIVASNLTMVFILSYFAVYFLICHILNFLQTIAIITQTNVTHITNFVKNLLQKDSHLLDVPFSCQFYSQKLIAIILKHLVKSTTY